MEHNLTFSIRIISMITNVNVSQNFSTTYGYSTTTYGYSQLDATDRKCRTYTKVCCGPIARLMSSSPMPIPLTTTTTTTSTPSRKKCEDVPRKKADLLDLVLFDAAKENKDCVKADEEMQVWTVTKDAKVTIPDLIGNIGGTLGVFIGFSFLGLFDNLIEFFKYLHQRNN